MGSWDFMQISRRAPGVSEFQRISEGFPDFFPDFQLMCTRFSKFNAPRILPGL